MSGFYDLYKPFRNYVRRCDLTSSLVDLWVYFRHLVDDAPLPPEYAVGATGLWHSSLKGHVFPWDLDTVTREVLLNAGVGGDQSLKRWGNLAVALNHVHRLEDEAFKLSSDPQDAVMIDLHRAAHRQFPWQQRIGINPMMRVFKVFGTPAMEAVVLGELGMTTRQYMRLGAALSGGVIRSPAVLTSNDYSVLKVPKKAVSAFLSRISISKEVLRMKLIGLQSYGRDWLYTWNPLEGTPLVGVDFAFPDRTLCPVPRYLLRRVSFGIYYDLVRAPGFDNAFGDAFQAYVGDILKATCDPARFQIRAERQYYVGGDKKHGVDWLLSDETAHLFIECKTKRLTLGSRTLSEPSALEKDVSVLAESVVQNYRNIQDALDGMTDWIADQRAVFSIILLMEDWFIISPKVSEMLNAFIERLLVATGLPTDLPQRIPYVIASANDFEIVCQVLAQTGIARVMSARPATQTWAWGLLGMLQANFKDEMSRINWRLFESEWHKTMASES